VTTLSLHFPLALIFDAFYLASSFNKIDVPLLQRSLTLWKELQDYYTKEVEKRETTEETRFAGPLLNLCGGMMIGEATSEVVSGTLRSIEEHQLPHRILSAAEIKSEFPVFSPGEDEIGVWEENAGYLNPELCIETYVRIATEYGAEAHFEEKLVALTEEENGELMLIKTDKGEYRARKVILTVGAWAPELYGDAIASLVPLHVVRRVLFWFKPNTEKAEQLEYFKVLPVILLFISFSLTNYFDC
jgi:sarcosine oxidase